MGFTGPLVLDPPVEGRTCGSCSLCCKTQRIDALAKPSGEWCPHCSPPGRGCAIYSARPTECATFRCSWLGGRLSDDLRPMKVRAVIGSNTDSTALTVFVDPGRPDAATKGKLAEWIEQVSRRLPVIIVCGQKRTLVYRGPKAIQVRNPETGELWLTTDSPETTVARGI